MHHVAFLPFYLRRSDVFSNLSPVQVGDDVVDLAAAQTPIKGGHGAFAVDDDLTHRLICRRGCPVRKIVMGKDFVQLRRRLKKVARQHSVSMPHS